MSVEPELETAVPGSAGVPPACLAGSAGDCLSIASERRQVSSARCPEEVAIASALAQSEANSLSHELELARDIQRAQRPKSFPRIPGYELAGFSFSARHLTGDFFDALPVGNDKTLLVIADVMGKGVPAALFAATLRPLLRTMLESMLDPAALLTRLNRLLFQELDAADVFITAQLAMVDSRRKSLIIASAGHCPLLFCDSCGETHSVAADGVPLGIAPTALFNSTILPLDEISCAVLFSDGLTDACNVRGETFGRHRLTQWLHQSVQTARSATELSAELQSELQSFQAHAPLNDDQTVLLLARQAE